MLAGQFTQTNWTGGVPGADGKGPWMKALGADQQEIKLEAGTHMVQVNAMGGESMLRAGAARVGMDPPPTPPGPPPRVIDLS